MILNAYLVHCKKHTKKYNLGERYKGRISPLITMYEVFKPLSCLKGYKTQ